jgi:hypothetical protein
MPLRRIALSVPTDVSKEDGMTGASGKLTNRQKLIYRTTTVIVCAVMIFSITIDMAQSFDPAMQLVDANPCIQNLISCAANR